MKRVRYGFHARVSNPSLVSLKYVAELEKNKDRSFDSRPPD